MARRSKRTIAFVTYPGMTLLELIAPMTTCLALTRGLLRQSRHYETVAVGRHLASVETDTPMTVTPDRTFANVASPFAVVVPGGDDAALNAATDERLVEYVASASRHAEIVCATSTGVFVLAAAGLLDGHRVATHPDYADRLRGLGVDCVTQPWVHDGRYLTAAGVSGAIDMTLHLVAQLKGEAAARDIQLMIEYDPAPPFGGLARDRTPHPPATNHGGPHDQ